MDQREPQTSLAAASRLIKLKRGHERETEMVVEVVVRRWCAGCAARLRDKLDGKMRATLSRACAWEPRKDGVYRIEMAAVTRLIKHKAHDDHTCWKGASNKLYKEKEKKRENRMES